ncbi:Hypothetical transmembrane protein coupled to NADH-ubiquinone oxidoreductase chain 5 homolog [Halorubrum sp. DM2]|uniref:DUF2309 domain-containing protein n=1 Tax=Halorubrum sp. DM2 TaxID=2527867 RepID=UPI0024B84BAC|nr:DUF2309 domain-containing protein [Halorubrum sp. DM2]VTT85639.1 Hypothetical transmembrane protein coupled to NADH-ubiquinone oxidoreductase chain 5 homolog [Halorubrum sp. DM2]
MSTERAIREGIDEAAETVGSVWPIHSFVTANPLSGFEDEPFAEAVPRAADRLGGRGYPSPETFRGALDEGRIDLDLLDAELAERGYEGDPETLLERMETAGESGDATAGETEDSAADPTERADRVLTKWLSAFLDEGRAEWSMPNREDGFYEAFRSVAAYDDEVPEGVATDLPASPIEAVKSVLEPYPEGRWNAVFEAQFAALPGWTGLLKRRVADGGAWQSAHPITLEGYLAVRLALLDAFDADIVPAADSNDAGPGTADELADAFLSAWEASYRGELVERVATESEARAGTDDASADERPAAQLVFCIDTRSEVIRRHVESTGDYETHGYAGFFGVPMEYRGYDSEVSVDACPPIVDAQHRVSEVPTDDDARATRDRWADLREAAGEVIETLKSNPATAFSFVEGAGSGYGVALAARTLVPGRVSDLLAAAGDSAPDDHEFCEPDVHRHEGSDEGLPVGLSRDERVEYAATAFELMGWEAFGRLVVFTGHASETANNPYGSSLDCGACAGNPGGPNARALAAICNDPEVKDGLRERGHDVPDDTVFLAAEHNTTTDEIELYDGDVPDSHADDLARLRADLATARENATAERVGAPTGDGSTGRGGSAAVNEAERRAGDWAETRPEWGLAGNAGFVVGPRELTSGLDLDGRAFLHSYDWTTDADGDALEAILTGPMVVTQWINAQYYFSTVDNAAYGSGSKVTHNPVGNVGVYQGNGGDLMTGLPLQSVRAAADEPYHQPLRLSTVVHAPVDRVTEILADNEAVAGLLDNDWLSLTVVDPTRDHRAFHYESELEWTPLAESERVEPPAETSTTPAAADD